jgi:hypothetical protein
MIAISFQGVLCRTLQGHGHWVNTLALSTDYVLRTGAFDPAYATLVPQDISSKSGMLLYSCFLKYEYKAIDKDQDRLKNEWIDNIKGLCI